MSVALWAGLSPVRQALPNGAVVTALRTETSPAVTISLMCRAGSAQDAPDAYGGAHLVARTLDCGTERLSADAMADALDDHGVALNSAVNRHTLSLSCSCLTGDFETMLALLIDALACPSFPDEGVEIRRAEILTALRQDDDNPAVQAERHLRRLLYGARHPYGRPVRGTFESVDCLDATALRAFHARHVHPAATSLVIAGDIEPAAALDAGQRLLGEWYGGPIDRLPRPEVLHAVETASVPAFSRECFVRPMMNKSQTDIAYGFIGLARRDPLYYAGWVMNTVFGQYGLGGRLGDNIRERQGMAYYVFCDLEADLLPGPLVIRAGVSAANVERTIAAIDQEVRTMVEDGITEEELADTTRYLVASMPRLLETNAGIAQFYQDIELFDLGIDFDRRLPDLLGAVTRATVAEAARQLMSVDAATMVVAGPYSPR